MFGKNDLNRILGGFNKVMADLKELSEDHTQTIAEKSDHIVALDSEIKAHDAERTQALHVLNNLETLLRGNVNA